MSGGTADPTHVYWDLENRRGLWARGEAMSKTPTARELLSHLRGGDFSPCDNPHHVEWLASRVEAVLALHVEDEWEDMLGGPPAKPGICGHCAKDWPCPTRRALEGEP